MNVGWGREEDGAKNNTDLGNPMDGGAMYQGSALCRWDRNEEGKKMSSDLHFEFWGTVEHSSEDFPKTKYMDLKLQWVIWTGDKELETSVILKIYCL